MAPKDLGTQPPKGFRDILPNETEVRDRLIGMILEIYRSFGFERIETPIVEDVRRLAHSDGGENLGMMFRILKRGDKLDLTSGTASVDTLADLALRYDLTVPLARYYAHNKQTLPSVFKAVQVGPSFRAERPQAGRYRQFYQFDIDILGGTAPGDEAELITASLAAYSKLGMNDGCMKINDRRILLAMIEAAGMPATGASRALITLDKLDKVGLSGVAELLAKDGFSEAAIATLLEIAGSIEAAPQSERLLEVAKKLHSVLDASICEQLQTIINAVTPSGGTSIAFDPFLVRGMGYYTGPVFEFAVPGFSGSMGGGGRYDGLIGKLSGVECTACGFSIGFERLVTIFADRLGSTESFRQRKVAVFYDNPSEVSEVLATAAALRQQGATASTFLTPKNIRAALDKLRGAGYTEFARFAPGKQLDMKSIT